jgi:hypothetical protein
VTDATHGVKTFTKLIDLSDSHVLSGDVVFKGVQLLDEGVVIRGAIPITVMIQVWDHESGSPEDIERKVSEAVQQAAAAAGILATALLSKPLYAAISAVNRSVGETQRNIGANRGCHRKHCFRHFIR